MSLTRNLAIVLAPTLLAVAPSPAAAGPSLRRAGDAVGSQTRGFAFHNDRSIGLTQFMFGYDAGEHGLTRIGHMVGVGAAHNWLSGADPAEYSYDIKHFPKPGSGEVFTATREDCTGECALGIPAAPAGHELVLAGFVFEVEGDVEHDLHTIAVEPDADAGIIWVELAGGAQSFDYDAAVQYAYVPTADVVGGAVLSATGTSDTSNPRVSFSWPQVSGVATVSMIQGFRIEYVGTQAQPLQYLHVFSQPNKANVWFHDASGNEPFEATLWVVPTAYATE